MRYSYSRVSLFEQCKYAFQFKYIFEIDTIPNLEPNNPLIIGSAVHGGIEGKDFEKLYLENFPKITDLHVNELIKMNVQVDRVIRKLNAFNCEYEVEIATDNFLGFIDLVIHNKDGSVSIFDFKYSNNVENYLNSRQLHIYKYYYQKIFNKPVKDLGYIFIPKTFIKQKKTEDLHGFRKRIVASLEQPFIRYVEYDETKVDEFFKIIKKIENTDFKGLFPKCNNPHCEYCRGENYMFKLPENKKREKVIDTKPDLWIYADSYVGKSTFVDKFEDLLFINTDGNTDNTESPFVLIRNEKKQEGRLIKTKFGWESFLEVIDSLETQENTFKTIAIDLVEDLRDLCRLYIFDKYNWEHESDGGFGKGWQMVSSEFNTAMKRLKSLGYQIVYISKEKREEVKLRNGNTRTIFTPNIDDKTANVLSGTVDLTVRAFIDEEGKRKLQLKKVNNAFGGGRFNFKRDLIDLDMNEFKEALIEAQDGVKSKEVVKSEVVKETTPPDTSIPDTVEVEVVEVEEKPKRRRKTKPAEEELFVVTDDEGNEVVNPFTEEVELEKTETKTRRRRRGE